ncbi:helix-turn-helix transcriptional regulator [Xanthomonas arboricola]|uniref:helix-turn-helix transcriptional regulator n=1 Tax=Xanthomonas arboricola TaxID=56448 RepID=UPI001AF53BB3|nr:helix-turn-helix transcriptional regulator [Xanthomonas arboricola]CAD7384581.1 helix-turn-helix transcriptional regulator [Xanthomonas arboricola]CAG2094765.1 helix-turn-helix transcriptional regulator [Xanthomonas arboricola pv. juglandis]
MKFSLASPQEIGNELAQRIRLARVARRMTQPELAERAGVSVGTIRNLERTGDCAFSTIIKIAQVLRLERGFEDLFKMGVQSIDELIQMNRASDIVRRHSGR